MASFFLPLVFSFFLQKTLAQIHFAVAQCRRASFLFFLYPARRFTKWGDPWRGLVSGCPRKKRKWEIGQQPVPNKREKEARASADPTTAAGRPAEHARGERRQHGSQRDRSHDKGTEQGEKKRRDLYKDCRESASQITPTPRAPFDRASVDGLCKRCARRHDHERRFCARPATTTAAAAAAATIPNGGVATTDNPPKIRWSL